MKLLDRLLKGHKYLFFVDFEGTQYSHELIAIGAIGCSLDRFGRIKRCKKPFKKYVKAKNKIGSYVINLTSITEDKLREEGVSFKTALEEFKTYCGPYFKKASFIFFGNHDLRILNQSIGYNFDFPKEICHEIQKNYVDLATFISNFIKDSKGNNLSLVHFCELFNCELYGDNHEPVSDAINLSRLYDQFIRQKQLVLEEYKKVLARPLHEAEPINFAIQKLAKGEDVSAQEFDTVLKKYLG